MMNNLFSIFDPSSSFISMNWLMLIIPLMWTKSFFMKKNLSMKFLLKMILSKVSQEMKQLMGVKMKKLSPNFTVFVFMFVAIMNTMALMPMNFTPTAHISINFPISLTLWLSTMMYGFVKSFKDMMTHLTPLGTPTPLMNFMVLIEMVSSIIRPITLSVRLTANMVAGHLLVSLLSNFSMMNVTNFYISFLALMTLSILELMVAMVQAYVLVTLMTLYHNEA